MISSKNKLIIATFVVSHQDHLPLCCLCSSLKAKRAFNFGNKRVGLLQLPGLFRKEQQETVIVMVFAFSVNCALHIMQRPLQLEVFVNTCKLEGDIMITDFFVNCFLHKEAMQKKNITSLV